MPHAKLIIPALVINYMNSHTVCASELESMDELWYALEFLMGDMSSDYLFDIDVESLTDSGVDNSGGQALSMSASGLSNGNIRNAEQGVLGKERSNEN